MKQVVAESENQLAVFMERKNRALSTFASDVDFLNLFQKYIFWLQVTEIAGGHDWIANFDHPQTKIYQNNFGKLSRILFSSR